MTTPTLIAAGGLASALVSAAVCYVLVPRLIARHLPALIRSLDPEEHPMIAKSDHTPRRLPAVSTLLIIALSVTLVVLGVQTYRYNQGQKESQRHEVAANTQRDDAIACLGQYATQSQVWADGVLDSLTERGDVTATLRKRDKAWHKRVDGIFQLVISSRAGVQFTDAQIDEIADAYQRAGGRLFAAYATADDTTADNPYPQLELTCAGEVKPK